MTIMPPCCDEKREHSNQEQPPQIFEQRKTHLLSSVIMFPQTPHRGCRTETIAFPYLHEHFQTFAEVTS